ncbi:MAG TPA: TIGR02117 family protein [Cytophagaceae bacterium]|nr:TIGR02117 family protein [Cytophagaceae bacterium]
MILLKKTVKCILYLSALIPLYLILALVLSYIPYNTDFHTEHKHPIEIQLHSNGVHTDILVPIENNFYNWHSLLPEITKGSRVVAFGWGDKGFYLNTPKWSDLKVSTACKAAFGLSTTALHVSYYPDHLIRSEHTVSIFINEKQYHDLCQYITSSFQHDALGKPIKIPHNPIYYSGQFYDAVGTYSLFTSCNSWVNKGLKKSGIKTCYWTPFDWPLFSAVQ